MNILIAPDSFKGSLSAMEVCRAIEKGIKRCSTEIDCILHPLSDGGEGALEAIKYNLKTEEISLTVHDPLFRKHKAKYLLSGETAYIEMAQASGLELLQPDEQNCLYTSSLGTGELIDDAISKGARSIYLFIGGSATNDLGIGMATALGYQFLDSAGKKINPIGKELLNLDRINHMQLTTDLSGISVNVVCDVQNVLYGPDGAAFVYAPQKGASHDEVELLDKGLRHAAMVIEKEFETKISHIPGSGAAGGIGAGAIAFLHASILPGIETIMHLSHFESKLTDIDLLITGEGKLDDQTLSGKLIKGVSDLCRKNELEVWAICGEVSTDIDSLIELGLTKVAGIMNSGITREEAILNAAVYIENLAYDLMCNQNNKNQTT